jgi:hypothetical protein
MVSPDSQAPACPLSGRNSTYRPVQNSGATSGDTIWVTEVGGTVKQIDNMGNVTTQLTTQGRQDLEGDAFM